MPASAQPDPPGPAEPKPPSAPPARAPVAESAPVPRPPLLYRLSTVMVFNLLVPVLVLALFKGLQDHRNVGEQTYGRLLRSTETLAEVWERAAGEQLRRPDASPRRLRERLTRATHRLLLESRRDIRLLRYAALVEPDGHVRAAVGEWPGDGLTVMTRGTAPALGDAVDPEPATMAFPSADGEDFAVLRRLPAADPDDPASAAAAPFLLAVYDSTGVRAAFDRRLLWLAAMDVGLAALVAVLGWLLVYRFVIRPVHELHRGARMIAAGRLEHRLPTGSPDELGLLAAEFNAMAEKLADGYRELEGRNARMRADRAYAGRLQQRLLPARLPEVPGWGFSVQYHPCEDLGGDFYDVFVLPDGRIALYVADVAGHGIGAALITVFIRETIARLRSGPRADGLADPGRTLQALKERFAEEEFGTLFVSMIYGVLDPADGRFRFSSAGHPMPLVCIDGLAAEPAEETGPVISKFLPDMEFPVHEIALPRGSRLLCYTDGVVDAMGPDGRAFGAGRLRRLMTEQLRLGGKEWTERAAAAIRAHVGDRPLTDDVTLLTVSVSWAGPVAPEVIDELATSG